MKFGNEFWLILFQEYISPKLFAVHSKTDFSVGFDLKSCVSLLDADVQLLYCISLSQGMLGNPDLQKLSLFPCQLHFT